MIYEYDITNLKPSHVLTAIQSKPYASSLMCFHTTGEHLVLEFEPSLTDEERIDLEETMFNKTLVKVKGEPPFADKVINGKSIFTRVTGQSFPVVIGNNDCDFVIPFPAMKINGVEIIGGEIGDSVNLYVLDTPEGLISGIANYTLNQFGYTTFVSKDYYLRESRYDADLVQDMTIRAHYYSMSAKTIYINYLIHELK